MLEQSPELKAQVGNALEKERNELRSKIKAIEALFTSNQISSEEADAQIEALENQIRTLEVKSDDSELTDESAAGENISEGNYTDQINNLRFEIDQLNAAVQSGRRLEGVEDPGVRVQQLEQQIYQLESEQNTQGFNAEISALKSNIDSVNLQVQHGEINTTEADIEVAAYEEKIHAIENKKANIQSVPVPEEFLIKTPDGYKSYESESERIKKDREQLDKIIAAEKRKGLQSKLQKWKFW